MNRTPEEQREYDLMQARWAFMTVKNRNYKEELIRICTLEDNAFALSILQFVLNLLGYPLTEERLLDQALSSIADDDALQVEMVETNTNLRQSLIGLIREKCIRDVFVPHSHPLSSTDATSVRQRRAIVAARGIEDQGLLDGIIALDPHVQNMVMSFTRQFGTEQDLSHDDSRRRFMQRYGLAFTEVPPREVPETAGAGAATGRSHHNSDETGSSYDPPSDHNLQQTGSSDKDEEKDDGLDVENTDNDSPDEDETDGGRDGENPDDDVEKLPKRHCGEKKNDP